MKKTVKNTCAIVVLAAVGVSLTACDTTSKRYHYEEDTTTTETTIPGHEGSASNDEHAPRRTVTIEEERSAPEIIVE